MDKEKLIELGITDEQADKILEMVKPIKDELEQLKPKEKSKAELDLEAREKAIAEKEKALAEQERVTQFNASAKKKGINEALFPFLKGDVDLDALAQAMNSLQLSSGFEPKIEQREDKSVTVEQFRNMGYTERINLYETNKALYDKLSEQS